MEKLKTQVHNALNGVAKQMIKADAREWPPGCMVFLYQPIRPQKKHNSDDQTGNEVRQ